MCRVPRQLLRPTCLPSAPQKEPSRTRQAIPRSLTEDEKVKIRLKKGQKASKDLRERKKRYEAELQVTLDRLIEEQKALGDRQKLLRAENNLLMNHLATSTAGLALEEPVFAGGDSFCVEEDVKPMFCPPPQREEEPSPIDLDIDNLNDEIVKMMTEVPPVPPLEVGLSDDVSFDLSSMESGSPLGSPLLSKEDELEGLVLTKQEDDGLNFFLDSALEPWDLSLPASAPPLVV